MTDNKIDEKLRRDQAAREEQQKAQAENTDKPQGEGGPSSAEQSDVSVVGGTGTDTGGSQGEGGGASQAGGSTGDAGGASSGGGTGN